MASISNRPAGIIHQRTVGFPVSAARTMITTNHASAPIRSARLTSNITHPFTAALPEEEHLLDTDPGAIHSRSYDLVCNGWEIGGGSIRIHDRDMQAKVFAILGISEDEARLKFGHMLEAFEFGAPPHGGTAMGIERSAAMLVGTEDIRDAMAFPKTKSASDPMTGAPSRVNAEQLKELRIDIEDVEDDNHDDQ